MGIVFAELSMSLDGFSAGSNISHHDPLGVNGERLHAWMSGETAADVDKQALDAFFANTGAFIIGRRTFDLGIENWGDDGAFGKPSFVLTHRPEPTLVKGPTTFNFVTEGIESALTQAKAAAGGQDVCVMGGAAAIQQYLKANQIDELRIHLIPLLLGDGTRLFDDIGLNPVELEITGVVPSSTATHLRYRIVR